MMKKPGKPTNLRQIRQRNDRAFLALVIFSLVVVGGLLIWAIYGDAALLTALPCLLFGVAAIAIPYGILVLIERLTQR